jgi:maltose alpha-D-glucosyltransferase/alpha-amylase
LNLKELPARKGKIAEQFSIQAADESAGLTIRRGSAEQSNSFVIYGDRLILKLFRRLQAGQNMEIEIGRYLTATAHFDRVPAFMGSIEYVKEAAESFSVGNRARTGPE